MLQTGWVGEQGWGAGERGLGSPEWRQQSIVVRLDSLGSSPAPPFTGWVTLGI